jgi:predicted transcriptional regulator
MENYDKFKNKLLKDRELKKAYDKLGPEFDFIRTFIQKRVKKGLTQKELAKKIGTRQSAISRLESGTCNPSFRMLKKVAQALDSRIKISIH